MGGRGDLGPVVGGDGLDGVPRELPRSSYGAPVTRTEIAEHVYLTLGGAPVSKAELVAATVARGHARPALLCVLQTLPDVTFQRLDDLWEHLPDVPVTPPLQ